MSEIKKELKNAILSSPVETYGAVVNGEGPPPAKNIFDVDIDSDSLRAQSVRLVQLKVDRYKSDTTDRKWLAVWATIIVSIWLFSVLVILVLNSLLTLMSDSVLITLLGTTTLNVLGLSFIVLRGHFNGEKESF
jgi:hypothetical protein